MLILGYMKNMGKRYEQPKTKKQKEGNITVEDMPRHKKKSDEKIGSYVDYEEVK